MHCCRSPIIVFRFTALLAVARAGQVDRNHEKGAEWSSTLPPYSSQCRPETSPVALTMALLGSLALKTLHEPFHLARRVHNTLLAREKRVALGANVNPQRRPRGTYSERIPTGAGNGSVVKILGMNLLFHLGHRLDVDLLLVLGAERKFHNAILDSKNGVITTDARV
jgi:hypothetical protein